MKTNVDLLELCGVDQANKNHHALVWGTEYEQLISITRAIDYYNRLILGFDWSYQLVAIYHHSNRYNKL